MALEYKAIGSNHTRKRAKLLTIEDVAARKPSRNHKKRHSVKAEIARFNERKKRDRKRYLATKKEILKQFNDLVRAYWKNEIDNHPAKPILPTKPKYTLPTKTRVKYK